MKTFTHNELCELMREHGVYGYADPSDEVYVSPTRKYFLGTFVDELTADLSAKGILEWRSEGGDCDDFGGWVWNHASQMNARMRAPAGIAVGRFKYVQMTGQGHAIGFAVHISNRKLTFIDRARRNGETIICETKLTPLELASCLSWFV